MLLSKFDLIQEFETELSTANSIAAIEQLKRKYTGKNSVLKLRLKELGQLPPEKRREVAQSLHSATEFIQIAITNKIQAQENLAIDEQLSSEWLDISLPGSVELLGARHPVKQVEKKILEILFRVGFHLVDGPEIETAFHNFDALNIPQHHPARELQDTFWLDNGLLLRSHTTTIQARYLETKPKFPVKIVASGRVYRNEAIDATHLAMFHQIEGFWIEAGLNLAKLKGLLRFIVGCLYGKDRQLRFKPKYYPYTEPSIGVDIVCTSCDGKGCDACHASGWVTIMGAGLIHHSIFELFNHNVDGNLEGLAFGFGLTRMVSQYFGLKKIKSLYEYDQRLFLNLQKVAS